MLAQPKPLLYPEYHYFSMYFYWLEDNYFTIFEYHFLILVALLYDPTQNLEYLL